MRGRVRRLRAGLVTPRPGGSGAPPARHYDRAARCSLDWDRPKPGNARRSHVPGSAGLELSARPSRRAREPQNSPDCASLSGWSAGRRGDPRKRIVHKRIGCAWRRSVPLAFISEELNQPRALWVCPIRAGKKRAAPRPRNRGIAKTLHARISRREKENLCPQNKSAPNANGPTRIISAPHLEKQVRARRAVCSLLSFWQACGHKCCLRARACARETNDCFARFWPLLPELTKISIHAGIEAKAAGLPPPEIEAAIERAQARWRHTQAPPQTAAETPSPAPEAKSPAPQPVEVAAAPPPRIAAPARPGPRVRVL